jgi:hypothetical protein
MRIILEGDNAFDEYRDVITVDTEVAAVAGLSGGMASGKPSVGFLIPLPDGKYAVAQTSMELFLGAARAFAARFGGEMNPQTPEGLQ